MFGTDEDAEIRRQLGDQRLQRILQQIDGTKESERESILRHVVEVNEHFAEFVHLLLTRIGFFEEETINAPGLPFLSK